MADIERTRVRERGAIEESPYEIFLRSRKEFDQRQMEGPVVIKPSDREYQITRQGRMFYYLNSQAFKDTPLHDWRVFTQDIKTHSGKHRHQGGFIIYVIEGDGYSVVDGERIDWKTGDYSCCRSSPMESNTSTTTRRLANPAAGSPSATCPSSTTSHQNSRKWSCPRS